MKQNYVLDIHTHTLASGHAFGTIREMAQAASERHLELLGVSEHGPGIPGTVEPIYFSTLRCVPRCLYGVTILHGCEINVLNGGTLSLDQKYIDFLDYAIIGIHEQCYQNEGEEKNTDHVISCMKQEKVHFLAHPDDDHTPLDYKRLVPAAKKYHVALEVNNNTFRRKQRRKNCLENYKELLSLCMEDRAPVLVSSDAHDPSQVGDISLAAEFLDQIGFDETLILNTDAEKFLNFISFACACGNV